MSFYIDTCLSQQQIFIKSVCPTVFARTTNCQHCCSFFLVWTTVSTCAMETFCPPGCRLSRTQLILFVTPRPAATLKTMWASLQWQSKTQCVWICLLTFKMCTCNNTSVICLSSNCEVLTTLTPDTGRILSKLHAVQPRGNISFCTGIRVAHVSLWFSW